MKQHQASLGSAHYSFRVGTLSQWGNSRGGGKETQRVGEKSKRSRQNLLVTKGAGETRAARRREK